MMRLRFSLRLLLVIIAVSAIGLYFLVVRPTAIAERFVAAIRQHDYETAKAMLRGQHVRILDHGPGFFTAADSIYAEVLPREWKDVWTCQRRVILRAAYHETINGGRVEWTHDTDLVARPNGLKVPLVIKFDRQTATEITLPEPYPWEPDYTLVP